MTSWSLYVLRLRDDSLYCGVTTNVARRVREHRAGGSRASKCVRAKLPAELVYTEPCTGRGDALRRERAFKGLRKAEKERRVRGWTSTPGEPA